MASSRPCPFDHDDPASGSVRPLSQADLQAILAHLNTEADRPVAAVRVQASVGRPGSAW